MWKIREMDYKDLKDILDIEKQSFPTPWTEGMFYECLSSEIYRNIVLEIEREITGYIMFYCVLDEAHITNFAVKPSFRKKGYGSVLLSYAIDYFRENGINECFLEVRERNQPAINLYRKFGFVIIGKRKRYYTDTNEDAYIMYLSLKDHKKA